MIIMIFINQSYDVSLNLSLKKAQLSVLTGSYLKRWRTVNHHSNFTTVITEFLRPFQGQYKVYLATQTFSSIGVSSVVWY